MLSDMTPPITEYVEGAGSGYTVRVDVLDPEQTPAVEGEGYGSVTPLFIVLNDGEVYADHDPHRLVSTLPGNNNWLLDQLDRLGREAVESHE